MRVDKTLSELWNLRACHSHDSFQELKEEASNTAFMAIGSIKNLCAEIGRLQERNSRYADKITKLKEQRKCLKQEYQYIENDIKSYQKTLEEIKKVYIYGQPNHEGEVMVEVEDTCDAMYQLAVDATTIID
jgi:FtsZ-binding cell division protein ZapB